MDNSVYLHLRQEAHRRRAQRDIQAEHQQSLAALSASKQPVRDAWGAWNPQRAAAQELQRQIDLGTLTLEVCGAMMMVTLFGNVCGVHVHWH
jgi:hypothetical protein